MTDLQRHADEVLVDHVTVDGVRVDFFHHRSFDGDPTGTERWYRLRRSDTGAERMVSHPKSGDPIKPALARRALAEWFVSYPDDALEAMQP
jgi:hypothetical protein